MKTVQKYNRPVPYKVIPFFRNPNYANVLRVIGQALEMLNVAAFDLEILGNDYSVTAHFMASDPRSVATDQEKIVRRSRYHRLYLNGKETKLELRFQPAEIAKLFQEFERRRGSFTVGSEIFGVAELLRVVGHYIDLKKARLIGIFHSERFITIRYETNCGENKHEYYQSSFFYNLFVRMYEKRG